MPFTMRIELPQVGESVTEGVIGRWLKRVGDPVERYDALVEVTTDKVNMEMPAPASGVLTRILVDEGAVVPMGAVIAEMDVEGDAVQTSPEPSPPAREPTADRQDRRAADRRSAGGAHRLWRSNLIPTRDARALLARRATACRAA